MSSLVDVLAPGDTMNGKSYEDFVTKYWTWLLGNASNKPLSDGVLYMRACYKYVNSVSQDNVVRRNNIECGTRPNREPVDSGVTTDTPIFCPMIDACFDESYIDDRGTNFDESLMRQACNRDIDLTERLATGRFATVPNIMRGPSGPEDIVRQPDIDGHRMEIPQKGTFTLSVPSDGLLREKMEDPAPTGEGPFQAVAVGYYIVFKIKGRGQYTVNSRARGPRNYIANMSYDITVS